MKAFVKIILEVKGRFFLLILMAVSLSLTYAPYECDANTDSDNRPLISNASNPDVFLPARSNPGTLGINSITKMKPEGEYEIYVLKGREWTKTGSLAFDRFFRELEIDLAPHPKVEGETRIRLVQKGGGAAHIDAVFLGGIPPQTVEGSEDKLALKKLSKKDFDVTDAYKKTIELVFPSKGGNRLTLTARVEGEVISKTPFQFPTDNRRKEMNTNSMFYNYELNSGTQTRDSRPFFREFSQSGSGHPSGFTYGWVRNDESNLYVSLDFTPDNTCDGDKDYAKVYAKTGSGVREFKVSVPETRWGKPQFVYTDKVAYQHKVYEFTIPLKELSITDVTARHGVPLELAFATYGTATAGDFMPDMAYDPVNNKYLVVYQKGTAEGYYFIYGQLLNYDGTVSGDEFAISNPTTSNFSRIVPMAAYDSSNQRYLVVWQDYRGGSNYDIYGQVVNASGTLYGTASDTNFVISNATDNQAAPAVAYDSENHRFLVVWEDLRNGSNIDVYGQLVDAAGTLYGTDSDENFAIASKDTNESKPSLAYDSVNHRFLVAWWDYVTAWDIYGQLVTAAGTLYGTASDENFVISNATGSQAYPAVAFDAGNQRFLVAWSDNRNGNSDIYGQLVNAAGTLYGTESDANFVISDNAFGQAYSSVAYDSENQRFLVAFSDYRSGAEVYGQLVNAAGTLYGTTSGTNFIISNTTGDQDYPSVAYNLSCSNFMVAYQTSGTTPPDIGLGLVGDTCKFTVTANADGNGSGTVSSDTGGIDYSYPPTSTGTTSALDPGTDVALTAAAATGSTVSWTTCTGTPGGNGTATATCSFSDLDNDKTATATFTLDQYTVTANAAGTGSGAVSSNTGGIDYSYPATGTETTSALDYGTNVVLTATAATGSTVSWTTCTGTKAGNGTAIATCTYSSLNGTKTAAATFTLRKYSVTANATGTGSGTVSSNTGGISYTYNTDNTGTTSALNYGTNVVLTAAAATGSTVVMDNLHRHESRQWYGYSDMQLFKP